MPLLLLAGIASITLSRRECAPAVVLVANRRGWIFKGLSVACSMACHPRRFVGVSELCDRKTSNARKTIYECCK
jgi:hypothetical protein